MIGFFPMIFSIKRIKGPIKSGTTELKTPNLIEDCAIPLFLKNDKTIECGVDTSEIKVIATGGLNSVLKPITDVFQTVDKQLTLKGLKRVADLFC